MVDGDSDGYKPSRLVATKRNGAFAGQTDESQTSKNGKTRSEASSVRLFFINRGHLRLFAHWKLLDQSVDLLSQCVNNRNQINFQQTQIDVTTIRDQIGPGPRVGIESQLPPRDQSDGASPLSPSDKGEIKKSGGASPKTSDFATGPLATV